jgi:hypothetical protein
VIVPGDGVNDYLKRRQGLLEPRVKTAIAVRRRKWLIILERKMDLVMMVAGTTDFLVRRGVTL